MRDQRLPWRRGGAALGRTLKLAAALAFALALAGHGAAHAAEGVDLRVRQAPASRAAPATLAMRAEPDDAPAAPAPASGPSTAAPAAGSRVAAGDRFITVPSDLETLSEKVIFHFQLGQDLQQGQLTGRPMGSGQPVPQGNRNTRLFTTGDLAVGSRGLLLTPLSTYLAAHFRFDQEGTPSTTSLPSIYDAAPSSSAVLVRSAYAEIGDLEGWLAPLRLRAGRQFRYGLGVAHFDGLSAWYEHPVLSASAFVGQRVSLYRTDLFAEGLAARAPEVAVGPIAGFSAELRLARLGGAPLLLGAEALSWDGDSYSQGTLRWQLTPDTTLSSFLRLSAGRLARVGAGVRARLSRTSTLSLDAEHRRREDWAYDMVVRSHDPGAGGDARFLYLGPAVPELRLSGRAGVVLLDNLDLLFNVAGSLPGGDVDSPWSAPYFELGFAIDGRLAFGLSLALGVRGRGYFRPEEPDPLAGEGEPMRFADLASTGEYSFYDGGLRVRYAVGRKRFAAEFELFARVVEDSHLERPPLSRLPLDEVFYSDSHAGTRFRVEGWLGARMRLLAEYEVTSTPVEFTELRGLQTLRILAEVSF